MHQHITSIIPEEQKTSLAEAQREIAQLKKTAAQLTTPKERDATARAKAQVASLQRELHEQTTFHTIVSRSATMKQIFDIMPEVAAATATVLVHGDSGTGKELIARSLHELSNRNSKPFIAINCSALPDSLLESELFGYRAGAFTDAKKDKPGRFARAEGGTLFLDEIGDISAAMQVKLLRVLQERTYEPLGATAPLHTNARIIAATNRNLLQMVADGSFREDLFYRINVVTIELPALRKRREDIPLLCNHFIERLNHRYNKNICGLTNKTQELLLSHNFPGNIRELENIIEHAFIFCKEDRIDVAHLPSRLSNNSSPSGENLFSQISNLHELEKMYIKSILSECNNNRTLTAQRLGIHKATLFRKLKQFAI